jgi:hypothetical protein
VIFDSLDKTLKSALPRIDLIVSDVGQMTDKLKRQPWRVIWPSTIKYPEEAQAEETPRRVPLKRKK